MGDGRSSSPPAVFLEKRWRAHSPLSPPAATDHHRLRAARAPRRGPRRSTGAPWRWRGRRCRSRRGAGPARTAAAPPAPTPPAARPSRPTPPPAPAASAAPPATPGCGCPPCAHRAPAQPRPALAPLRFLGRYVNGLVRPHLLGGHRWPPPAASRCLSYPAGRFQAARGRPAPTPAAEDVACGPVLGQRRPSAAGAGVTAGEADSGL